MHSLRLFYPLRRPVLWKQVCYSRVHLSGPSSDKNPVVSPGCLSDRSVLPLEIRRKVAEEKSLSSFINSVHDEMRDQWRKEKDPEQLWADHTSNKEVLQLYAAAIHHRQERMMKKDQVINRPGSIAWCYSELQSYFRGELWEKSRDMEHEKVALHLPHLLHSYSTSNTNAADRLGPGTRTTTGSEEQSRDNSSKGDSPRLRVLDVGSCFNPFKGYSDLDVTALDLLPATEDTYQCDFFKLKIIEPDVTFPKEASILSTKESNDDTRDGGRTKVIPNSHKTISSLPANSFDAVIFAALLSYIPCPEQRLLCCKKAYRLIKPGGVLIVGELDSRGTKRKSYIYDSWNVAFSTLGFSRIKYRKANMFHGMLFRKGLCPEVHQLLAKQHLENLKERKLRMLAERSPNEKIRLKNELIKAFDVENSLTGLWLWHNVAEILRCDLSRKSNKQSSNKHKKTSAPLFKPEDEFKVTWYLSQYFNRFKNWIWKQQH